MQPLAQFASPLQGPAQLVIVLPQLSRHWLPVPWAKAAGPSSSEPRRTPRINISLLLLGIAGLHARGLVVGALLHARHRFAAVFGLRGLRGVASGAGHHALAHQLAAFHLAGLSGVGLAFDVTGNALARGRRGTLGEGEATAQNGYESEESNHRGHLFRTLGHRYSTRR